MHSNLRQYVTAFPYPYI